MKKNFRFYTGAGLRTMEGALVDGKVALVSPVKNGKEIDADRAADYSEPEINSKNDLLWSSEDGIKEMSYGTSKFLRTQLYGT